MRQVLVVSYILNLAYRYESRRAPARRATLARTRMGTRPGTGGTYRINLNLNYLNRARAASSRRDGSATARRARGPTRRGRPRRG
eukprot:SAG31_NODE_24617_length_477_cov_34.552910_1_plen_84_part_10